MRGLTNPVNHPQTNLSLRSVSQVPGLASVFSSLLAICGSLATLLCASPGIAPFLPPLAFVYARTMNHYRPSFRELKRVNEYFSEL